MPQRNQASDPDARRSVVRVSIKAASGTKIARYAEAERVAAAKEGVTRIMRTPAPASAPTAVTMPGFVGMLHGGRADLSVRAKKIVRGTDVLGDPPSRPPGGRVLQGPRAAG